MTWLERFGSKILPHQHQFEPMMEIVAPVGEPPGHTKFVILLCPCGLIEFFPPGNFLLTSIDYQAELIAQLTIQRFWLEK